MSDVHRRVLEMEAAGRPFALATVVRVHGSSSARPGSKAVIDHAGRNVLGWVGGGCAEAYVCAQAVEAMADGVPRVVEADLDDEVFGLGMPCGGRMEVYVEPYLPRPRLRLGGDERVTEIASALAGGVGFTVVRDGDAWSGDTIHLFAADASDTSFGSDGERAVDLVARALVAQTGATGRPLAAVKGVAPAVFPVAVPRTARRLLVVGHSRITEAVARLGALLGWAVTVRSGAAGGGAYPPGTCLVTGSPTLEGMEAGPDTCVVVASHHRGDHLAIAHAIGRGAPYVGLIASAHRSRIIRAYLGEMGLGEAALAALHAPAGLDLGATTPAGIALSVVSHVLALRGAAEAGDDEAPEAVAAD
jgi:xanthine/CO dehydrogenase XdhC/CoxF family maturation factor